MHGCIFPNSNLYFDDETITLNLYNDNSSDDDKDNLHSKIITPRKLPSWMTNDHDSSVSKSPKCNTNKSSQDTPTPKMKQSRKKNKKTEEPVEHETPLKTVKIKVI